MSTPINSLGIVLFADDRRRLPNGTIGFDDQEPDDSGLMEFVIRNDSDVDVTIDDVFLELADQYQIVGESAFEFPITLAPGDTFEFEIRVFSEEEVLELLDFLQIESSVAGAPLNFRLLTKVEFGEAGSDAGGEPEPELVAALEFRYEDVVTEEIDLGDLDAEEAHEFEFTIHNTGTDTLQISALDLDSAEGPGISLDGVSSLSILPGESATVTMSAFRLEPGDYSNFITVTSNATGAPHVLAFLVNFLDVTPFAASADNDVNEAGFFSDGSMVVAGGFASINSTGINKIAFLQKNGGLKPIASPMLLNESVTGLVVVDDDPSTGWFVVVGNMTEMSGVARVGAAAINANGTHRTSFGNPAITFGGGFPEGVLLTPAGKLLIYGGFASVNGVANTARIALFNTNGTRDTAFTGYADNRIYDAVTQPDGMVVLVGAFTSWKGVACAHVIRINPVNGDLDGTFTLDAGTTNEIYSVDLDSNGKLFVGITQQNVAGHGGSKLHRISSTGAWEAALGAIGNIANSNFLYEVKVDSAGRIVFGGSFAGPVDGQTGGGVGAVDSAGDFIPGWGGGSGVFGIDGPDAGNFVRRIHLRPGDVAFAVGRFTSFNGSSRIRIAKFRPSTGALISQL